MEDGAFIGASPLVAGVSALSDRIHAAGDKQAGAADQAGFGGVLKRFADDLGRRLMLEGKTAPPRAAVTVAEAEVEEEGEEVGVVVGDVARAAVVDGLAVVGLGAGVEQQAGQGQLTAVGGCALFAVAENAGEGR